MLTIMTRKPPVKMRSSIGLPDENRGIQLMSSVFDGLMVMLTDGA
jgi:hypothetical protein